MGPVVDSAFRRTDSCVRRAGAARTRFVAMESVSERASATNHSAAVGRARSARRASAESVVPSQTATCPAPMIKCATNTARPATRARTCTAPKARYAEWACASSMSAARCVAPAGRSAVSTDAAWPFGARTSPRPCAHRDKRGCPMARAAAFPIAVATRSAVSPMAATEDASTTAKPTSSPMRPTQQPTTSSMNHGKTRAPTTR